MTMYGYFGVMAVLALASMYYQWKAAAYGHLEAIYAILAMGTGPTKRQNEDDVDTDKEL